MANSRTPMAKDKDPLKGDKYNYSPSLLLRRVLREELAAQDLHRNHKNNKLLVTAVHAVLLDSGFIRFDSGMSVHATLLDLGFAEFASVSGMSYSYTLPDANRDEIVLKFKNEGNFSFDQGKRKDSRIVKVTGSLINSGSSNSVGHKYEVRLDERKIAPVIEFFWGNNTRNNDLGYRERQVCEFWKIVKDGIAFPLLIDLCAKASLPAPPCLMSLPLELKMKILESMPGADLAKLGSLCKELRDLSNDNVLWKHKFDEEEFSGTREEEQDQELWKVIFSRHWETKKEQQMKEAMQKKRGRKRTHGFHYEQTPKRLVIDISFS